MSEQADAPHASARSGLNDRAQVISVEHLPALEVLDGLVHQVWAIADETEAHIAATLDSLYARLGGCRAELQDRQDSVDSLSRELGRLQDRVVYREQEVQRLHNDIVGRDGEIARLTGLAKEAHAELRWLHPEAQRLHREVALRDAEIERLRAELEWLHPEAQRLHREVALREAEIERLRGEASAEVVSEPESS